MKIERIKETFEIIIDKYPYSQSLNEKLLEDSKRSDYPANLSYEDNYKFYAKHSDFNTSSKSIDIINSWVINVLRIKYPDLIELKCADSWFALYNKGDWVTCHDHTPNFYSYVYFVDSPKGSSPLVFSTSNKKIQPLEGVVVLFDGGMRHHVPPNKCEDRVVLAGNIVPYYNNLV